MFPPIQLLPINVTNHYHIDHGVSYTFAHKKKVYKTMRLKRSKSLENLKRLTSRLNFQSSAFCLPKIGNRSAEEIAVAHDGDLQGMT